jgi:hypothetical protein
MPSSKRESCSGAGGACLKPGHSRLRIYAHQACRRWVIACGVPEVCPAYAAALGHSKL